MRSSKVSKTVHCSLAEQKNKKTKKLHVQSIDVDLPVVRREALDCQPVRQFVSVCAWSHGSCRLSTLDSTPTRSTTGVYVYVRSIVGKRQNLKKDKINSPAAEIKKLSVRYNF